MDMLSAIPLELCYIIAIFIDSYEEYKNVAKVCQKLGLDDMLLRARKSLTKVTRFSIHGSRYIEHRLDGELHRDDDMPAVVIYSGTWTWTWYIHGIMGRTSNRKPCNVIYRMNTHPYNDYVLFRHDKYMETVNEKTFKRDYGDTYNKIKSCIY